MTLLRFAPFALAVVSACAADVPFGFSSSGDWKYSSLAGYAEGKASLWSNSPGAAAVWNPALKSVGPVRVWFYLVAHPTNDRAARIEVVHGGRTEAQSLDMTSGESRWVDLGRFDFAGAGGEYVRLEQTTRGRNVRAAAVKFDILDAAGFLWQTVMLDELVPYDLSRLASQHAVFEDMQGHWAEPEAGLLAARGILPGVSASRFEPDRPIGAGELTAALKALGVAAPAATTGTAVAAALAAGAQATGKNLDWMKRRPGEPREFAVELGLLAASGDPADAGGSPLTRAQAAALLRRYQRILLESGPPAGEPWELAFSDDFDGSSLDWNVWESSKGEHRLLCTRWPENAVVSDGLLKLVTRKEKRGPAEWTAAFVWTKFRQPYGYWEARYRYAAATGLNQAFWMHPFLKDKDLNFEIDVNEGHFPSEVNSTLHQSGLASNSTRHVAPFDLARDFHTYAVDWNEQEVVYYVDGAEIARKKHVKARQPAPAMFSTAVMPSWAGPVTEALDGKSMDVDWVRVYRRKPR